MAAPEKQAEATEEVLAEVEGILEPVGLQEETELPARIMEEFVRNSRKKDKLLCSQLQVVNFLQNFLAQEDIAQSPDNLLSEDTSRQKATEAKEQWKELKAVYQDHVEAIKSALTQALPQAEEAQRKYTELQEAYKQLQTKKRIQKLAEISAEAKERQAGTQQKLDQSNQELETLKLQEGQEEDKLRRNQTYLQLLCTLQNKPQVPEAKPEDKDVKGSTLPPESL
ncbi:ZW10 interactor [Microtus ochrogaster]|uniref:ZW10 interactor n=1 Tax=Microtus ochrogaster TaxID=79684 RepID=A0A8J6KXS6_MICOH|nr:ZW10 interactor [Microtus ochrogaster]